MTGHGCGCGKSSCNVCSHSHHNHCSSWGKDVFYGNDNLRRFFVSCGENFDAIIEKAFNFTADVKELFLEFEQETLEKFTSITVELNAIKIRLAALEAGGGSTDLTQILADIATLKGQMTTVISNIGTLSNLTTTAKTNLVAAINEIDADLTALSTKIGDLSTLTTTDKTTVVKAINEVNAKTTLGTLNNLPGVTTQATNFTDAINDRQPVWKKSTTVTIGSSQPAPFNNLETAIIELAKYHSSNYQLMLEDGTYTVTNGLWHQPLSLDRYVDIKGASGNAANVIITTATNGTHTIVSGVNRISLEDLTLKNTGTGGCLVAADSAFIFGSNIILENTSNATTSPLLVSLGSAYLRESKIINKSTNPVTIALCTNQSNLTLVNTPIDNQGNANSNAYLSQVESKLTVIHNKPGVDIVGDVDIVFNAYLNSSITCYPYHSVTFDNIGWGLIQAHSNSEVTIRTQTPAGVYLPITVNGRNLTSNGSIIASMVGSRIVHSKIIANTFNRFAYAISNSKIEGEIEVTNVTHGIWLDRNCSLHVNGSIATTGNQGLSIFNNSDVATDNLQVSGQSAGINKVLMINACRLCRNSSATGSNIGNDISFSGAGNIVTG